MATLVDTTYDLPDTLNYKARVLITDSPTSTGNILRVRMFIIRGSGTGRYSSVSTNVWSIAATSKTTQTGPLSYDFRGTSEGYQLEIADETFTYTIAQGSQANVTVRTKFSTSADNLGPFDKSNSVVIYPLVTTPAPTAPTFLSATTSSPTQISLSWSGATGSIDNYGIFYSTSSMSVPSSPQFTTSGTETTYIDTTATAGQYRYYWVRAQGPGGNSSWYPTSAQGGAGGLMPIQYVVYYTNSYGSNGSSQETVNSGNSGTFPSPGSRSGYVFNGWNNNSSYTPGSQTPAISSTTTYSANNAWTLLSPGFVDESVTGTLYIGQTIESTGNSSVSATNTTSYALQYSGTGLNPTWLSINPSSGDLSGSTNVPGLYTFRVAATGTGGTVYSGTLTINVFYPGRRTNSTFGQSTITTAKRWDGSQWVALTQMKRWNGSSWVNISNL